MRTWQKMTLMTTVVILIAATVIAAEPACKTRCKTTGPAIAATVAASAQAHAEGDCTWHSRSGCDHAKAYFFPDDDVDFIGGGAFLGIQMQSLTGQLADYFGGTGVLVAEVIEDSPAAAAGLKAGDVITKLDDQAVEDSSDIQAFVADKKKNDKVKVTFLRKRKTKTVKVTLGEREDQDMTFGWTPDDDDNDFEIHRFPRDMKRFWRHAPRPERDIMSRRPHRGELDEQIENLRADIEELRAMVEELKAKK